MNQISKWEEMPWGQPGPRVSSRFWTVIPPEKHVEEAEGRGVSFLLPYPPPLHSVLTSIHSTCLGFVVQSLREQSVWGGGGAEQGEVEKKGGV